tara:strand:+ start:78 stop:362 length:285 start_codon:yes stop_codon:yes gene_type:complete
MFNKRELLETKIEKITPLKKYIVDYVGNKLESDTEDSSEENIGVTVEMIIDVLADDFPEIVFALAEENFMRGYQQGLEDMHIFSDREQDNDIQE